MRTSLWLVWTLVVPESGRPDRCAGRPEQAPQRKGYLVVVGGPADRVLVTGLAPAARAPAVGLVSVLVDDPGVRDLTHENLLVVGVDPGGPRKTPPAGSWWGRAPQGGYFFFLVFLSSFLGVLRDLSSIRLPLTTVFLNVFVPP